MSKKHQFIVTVTTGKDYHPKITVKPKEKNVVNMQFPNTRDYTNEGMAENLQRSIQLLMDQLVNRPNK